MFLKESGAFLILLIRQIKSETYSGLQFRLSRVNRYPCQYCSFYQVVESPAKPAEMERQESEKSLRQESEKVRLLRRGLEEEQDRVERSGSVGVMEKKTWESNSGVGLSSFLGRYFDCFI